MASQRTTHIICQHLRQLWNDGPGLTLEYTERWTARQGQRLSRQSISRALNGRVTRMRDATAAQLAKFIECHTRGVISSEFLLGGGNDWLNAGNGAITGIDVRPPTRHQPGTGNSRQTPASKPAETWQMSIQTHLESLWQARGTSPCNPDLLLFLYQHLGDEHLWGAQEYAIAGAYYETALTYTRSARPRSLLLCRIALVNHFTGHPSQPHLDKAVSLAPDDPEVTAWDSGVRALVSYVQDQDFDQTIQLAERALKEPALIRELHFLVLRMLLKALGKTRRVTALDRQADMLLGSVSAPADLATAHEMLGTAYAAAGCVHKALSHIRSGLELYSTLENQESDQAHLHMFAGSVYLNLGDVYPAREHLKQCLLQDEEYTIHTLGLLCKSWIHDHLPQGQHWARRLVESLVRTIVAAGAYYVPDAEYMNTQQRLWRCFTRLGAAERILHHYGLSSHLHRPLEAAANASEALRGLVWFAGAPQERAVLRDTLPFDDWTWHAGGPRARFEIDAGRITIHAATYRGIVRMNMPRMTCVTGSRFAMQARIHGAGQMVRDTLRCRQHAHAGVADGTALGGGGILMTLGERTAIRISAHVLEPGEVVCEMRQHGQPRPLGRGFFGEEPLFLRMEGHGDRVQLLAGLSAASLSVLGTAKVELSDNTTTGIFAEASMDLQAITAEAETVFDQVRVEIG